MTRSLPATIALPPSLASMLATRMKRGAAKSEWRWRMASAVTPGFRTKHFWFARMVARMTSGGISRNFSSKRADQHDRPFDEAGDLFQQPLVLDQFEAERQRLVAGAVQDDVLAPVGIEHDLGLVELRHVVVEPAHLIGSGAMKRWP